MNVRLLNLTMAFGHIGKETTSFYIDPSEADFIESFLPKEHLRFRTNWHSSASGALTIRLFWKTTTLFPMDMLTVYGSSSANSKRFEDMRNFNADFFLGKRSSTMVMSQNLAFQLSEFVSVEEHTSDAIAFAADGVPLQIKRFWTVSHKRSYFPRFY
jgi:hypothetical protein